MHTRVQRPREYNARATLHANAEKGVNKAETLAAPRKTVAAYPSLHLFDAASQRKLQTDTFQNTRPSLHVLMVILALPSLLALINTLAIGVLARMREIGMLRAVGSTRRQVRRMVLAESLLLASLGTLLGIISGVWLGYSMRNATSSTGFSNPYYLPWNGIVAALFIGIVFGVLAAIIPARQAAKLDIVRALQYE